MAGQNPSMVIRVAATIAELRANLAEGKSQIETTTAAMQKMAASFSGDKIIQAAHNVVAAVNQIGGASNLTEREQARVNATLEKALEKYRVLGKEAPAGMQKLADETKQVDASSFKLTDTVKQLALGFAAMFTARAAFNFVKSTIDEAAALKDLSQQTHINVEELQLLAGAMSEFGVDADMLGNGLFNLGRRIAKGDDSVVLALRQMGMSLRDVQGLEGEELFLTIERGLARLHGSLRDTTAADLFGSRLGMAMAGASEGIDGAMESARRLNTVMSEESVDALDRYDEAIKRAQRSLSAMAANMVGPVAEGFNVIVDAAGNGVSKWDLFVAMTKDWAASNSVTGASTSHLAKLLDELNQKTDQGIAKIKETVAAHDEAAGAMQRREAATESFTTKEIAAAEKVAKDWETIFHNMRETGLAAEEKLYDDMVKIAQAGVDRKNAAIFKGFQDEWKMEADSKALTIEHGSTALQVQLAQIARWVEETENAARANGVTNQSYYDALAELAAEKTKSLLLNWTTIATDSKAALQEIADKHKATYEFMLQDVDAYVSGAVEKQRQLAEASAAAVEAQRYAVETVLSVGQKPTFTPSRSNFMFGDRPPSGGSGYQVPQFGTPAPASSLAQTGVVVFSGGVPGLAHGGPVSAGEPYIVGERGAELFVPSAAGAIVPNGSGGSNITIAAGAVQINYPLMNDPRARMEIAAMVGDALMQRLRGQGLRVASGA